MATPKIVVPIADGSEEMEAVIIIDILRRANFDVTCAAVSDSTTITASRGVKIAADCLWQEIDPTDFDAIILPGGMGGTEIMMQNKSILQTLKEFNRNSKLVGAICAGPLVLQAADMLDKRTVTCHPGVATDLTDSPRSSQRVIKSGNLITSQGPGTAMEFALAIIEQLSDKATAEKVRAGLVI